MNIGQRRTVFALCFLLCLTPFIPSPTTPGVLSELFQFFFRDVSSLFDQHIKEASDRYGLDHCLVKALIEAESHFDHVAISPKGAMGLMQLMPATARDMGVTHPFNPRENIEGGTRYLKYLLKRFNNDVTLALAAYNAGPEVVKRHGGVPPYRETREYLKKVMGSYSYYKLLHTDADSSDD